MKIFLDDRAEERVQASVATGTCERGELIVHKMLSPASIARLLLSIALSLLAGHLLVIELGAVVLELFRYKANFMLYEEIYYSFFNQFHLAKEGNISTYFSSFNLALAAVLLFVIHTSGKKQSLHWLYLGIFFLFLSVDESAQIHETFGGFAGEQVNARLNNVPAFLSWAWMLPYSVLVIFVVLYFFRFTLDLPDKTRNLFYLSGGVYVFAALVLEFFESHFDTVLGPENLVNRFLFPGEEFLEMMGVIIFIYALLDYLVLHYKGLQLSFSYKK